LFDTRLVSDRMLAWLRAHVQCRHPARSEQRMIGAMMVTIILAAKLSKPRM
jgi:hypothetical protein